MLETIVKFGNRSYRIALLSASFRCLYLMSALTFSSAPCAPSEAADMRVTMTTIEHAEQRYDTVGDWYFNPHGDLRITVSRMSDPRYETLVAVHELVEAVLCKQAGVSEEAVTAFDVAYEAQRQPGDVSEPGDDPEAPYHKQHVAATHFEKLLATMLGVDWDAYAAEVELK